MNELEEARASARALVGKLGLKAPPVPVEKIAKASGARVEFSPFDEELSGMAFIRDGRPVIGVNSNHHPNRQRFTIAHELGHVLLHRSKLGATVMIDKGRNFLPRDSVSTEGVDRFEMQANAFASELLMPEWLIRQVLSGSSRDIQDDDYLISIANRFRVSLAALQFRLGRL